MVRKACDALGFSFLLAAATLSETGVAQTPPAPSVNAPQPAAVPGAPAEAPPTTVSAGGSSVGSESMDTSSPAMEPSTGGPVTSPPFSGVQSPTPTTAASESVPVPTWEALAPQEGSLVEAAERAVLDVDYERSLALAERAISRGALTRDEVRRAYLAVAFSAAQLDRPDLAQPAFLKLFALEPNVDFSRRLAPARRSAAMTARGYWAVQGSPMGVNVDFDRDERKVLVTTQDPLNWLRQVDVWVRKPGEAYSKYVLKTGSDSAVEVEAGPLDVLEVYAFALDAYGNTIVEVGSSGRPRRFEPQVHDRVVFERDIRGGETGAYAKRLTELGNNASVHGYASLELGPRPDGKGATFDLHHATMYFRAALPSHTSMEVGLELEHLATSIQDLYVPHAFVDVAFTEWLVVRPGFFEAPVGAFNEYLYPDFLRTSGLPPLFSRVVVPGLWSEVGVQVRGRVALFDESHVTYAVFVSNGLEQQDAQVGDGVVEEGGELRDMRFNVRDRFNSDKAFGGRLGLQAGGFDLGVSGYTGRYTIDADRSLDIVDVDVSYKARWFTLRAEGAAAFQQLTRGQRAKRGAYALASSRPEPHLEPYVQYDVLEDGPVTHRVLLGNAVYPFPEEPAARTLRLKTEIGFRTEPAKEADLIWFTQLVSAF